MWTPISNMTLVLPLLPFKVNIFLWRVMPLIANSKD